MTFDELWRIVCERNPQLAKGDTLHMTPNGFCKAMKLAYDKGAEHERGKTDPGADLFNGLFGREGGR